MRYLITLILVFISNVTLLSQESYLHIELDTIKANYRTGGYKLDSIDLIYSEKFISTPGSFTTNPFGKFGCAYSSVLINLKEQHREIDPVLFRHAAIPHLGTYYAFGSKGTQYLTVDYNHSFNKKIHFSMQYKRNVAAGAYRFNSFGNDAFSIGLLYLGSRWKHVITTSTFKQQRNLNGGVTSFEEIENFGLEYAKVRKQSTSDSISFLKIRTENEFGLFKKDSLHRFGLIFKNQLIIDKRVFKEKDSLTTWYPNQILFDTLNTRDLTQFSRLDNQMGIRFKNKRIYSEFLLANGYWKYKTSSFQIINEVDLLYNIYFKSHQWSFGSKNQLNLIGAKQQSLFNFIIQRKGDISNLSLILNQSNVIPTPLQRNYITNTLFYSTSNLNLQHSQTATFSIKTNAEQSLCMSLFYGNFQNQYYFINNSWRNDTLTSISQISLNIKGDYNVGLFHFQPNFTFNLIDQVQIVPKYDLRSRLFISKKFKRPGTIFNLGVDINYKSKYQLLTYDDRISLYKLEMDNNFYSDYCMLDAFVSMQLDEFRMYFKMENIDTYWSNPRNTIAENYPIVPSILRLGLTWDFFN